MNFRFEMAGFLFNAIDGFRCVFFFSGAEVPSREQYFFASFCALFAFHCLTSCGCGDEKKAITTDKAIPTPEELKERYKDVKFKPISLGE